MSERENVLAVVGIGGDLEHGAARPGRISATMVCGILAHKSKKSREASPVRRVLEHLNKT
jgi:hypothetical protein